MNRLGRTLATTMIGIAFLGLAPGAASAHPLKVFTLCAAFRPSGGQCLHNASYSYGDTVYLRGELRPPHAWMRVQILRKRPGASAFVKVATADISAAGHVRWSWRTAIGDAHQNAPYQFKLRLRNHGVGNPIRVWVLFGE
jgi:hypothetical protein